MSDIVKSLIIFLAIINPFALCLYVGGMMGELDMRQFLRVMIGACMISFVVFALFALTGETILVEWLNIHPGALRSFGGLVFLVVGYNYVTTGYRAAEKLRGSLEGLPSAIAMPFMIGAGTITQSIIIGKQHSGDRSMLILLIGLAIALGIVLAFKVISDHVKGRREAVFERYVNILARINGLIIGAISIEMIVLGLRSVWNAPQAS